MTTREQAAAYIDSITDVPRIQLELRLYDTERQVEALTAERDALKAVVDSSGCGGECYRTDGKQSKERQKRAAAVGLADATLELKRLSETHGAGRKGGLPAAGSHTRVGPGARGISRGGREVKHGTAHAYRLGCRCLECAQGAATRRRRGLPEGDPRHGTENGYSNRGCRCEACVAAHAVYCRERELGRSLDGPDDPRHGTENGYGNFNCRCRDCTTAWSAATYARRLRAEARKANA